MTPPPPEPPDDSVLARQEAEDWLRRAERDLGLAMHILATAPHYADMASYHAQQAAEKALKAFLTARQVVFRRVHDVAELQRQCEELEPGFARFAAAARTLTQYATEFRYPGGRLEPSRRPR